jgi:hypothetical protein
LAKVVYYGAKAVGYLALGAGLATFAGAYALYGRHLDKKKQFVPGTTFKNSPAVRTIKDASVKKIRSWGVPILPSYRTAVQLAADAEEERRKIREAQEQERASKEARHDLEMTVQVAFRRINATTDAKALMVELDAARERANALGADYAFLEFHELINKTAKG